MSIFKVEVMALPEGKPHPNADALTIYKIKGYTYVGRTEDWKGITTVAYLPVDAVPNLNEPEMGWLRGTPSEKRVCAMKLRGVYSEGVLLPARPHWKVGDDVAAELGVVHYEAPPNPDAGYENEAFNPGWFKTYTDIQPLKANPGVLQEGEEVYIYEKVDGENYRFVYSQGRLWVGSYKTLKKADLEIPAEKSDGRQFMHKNQWSQAAKQFGLELLAARLPDHMFVGEFYGTARLKYGRNAANRGLVLFDILRLEGQDEGISYLSMAQMECVPMVKGMMAPLLYKGPWREDLISLAEGDSKVPGAGPNHMMEGIVIRPVHERWDPRVQRCIFKVISERYRLKKMDQGSH